MIGNKSMRLLIDQNIFTDKIGLKMAIFCQINYYKNIFYFKFYSESIGDNF